MSERPPPQDADPEAVPTQDADPEAVPPQDADPEAVPTQGRAIAAAAIVVAHAIKHAYNSSLIALIMPEIKITLGLSRSQFGSLSTSSAIAWWFSTMISGYLGDRFSNHAGRMLAVSMSVTGIAFSLVGIAPNYLTMLAVMFLAGIGPSMFHPPAIGELSRRFPDRRGFAISLHGVGANVGEVLGSPIVAAFLTFLTLQEFMTGSLAPALLIALLVLVLVPSRKTPGARSIPSMRSYFAHLLGLLKTRFLMLLIAATALISISEGTVSAFLTLYMRDDLAYSRQTVALFIAFSQIAGIFSLPIMGLLSDRVGSKPVLVMGTGLAMLSVFGVVWASPGYQLFLVVLVRGAFTFSLRHIFIAAALNAVPRGLTQSTITALIYGSGIAGTLSPYVAGIISDRFGIHSAFLYGGSVLILPTLLLALMKFPPHSPRSGGGH